METIIPGVDWAKVETMGAPMVGPNKILTVSYGTFSCTLEGFEEPFSTMKAIAEYFRDLAADDRYFGAEPPQPDAAMLHRIAEREVQRRVEAQIGQDRVILRASEPATADSVPMPAPTVSFAATPGLSESVAAKLQRLRDASRGVPTRPDVAPAAAVANPPSPVAQVIDAVVVPAAPAAAVAMSEPVAEPPVADPVAEVGTAPVVVADPVEETPVVEEIAIVPMAKTVGEEPVAEQTVPEPTDEAPVPQPLDQTADFIDAAVLEDEVVEAVVIEAAIAEPAASEVTAEDNAEGIAVEVFAVEEMVVQAAEEPAAEAAAFVAPQAETVPEPEAAAEPVAAPPAEAEPDLSALLAALAPQAVEAVDEPAAEASPASDDNTLALIAAIAAPETAADVAEAAGDAPLDVAELSDMRPEQAEDAAEAESFAAEMQAEEEPAAETPAEPEMAGDAPVEPEAPTVEAMAEVAAPDAPADFAPDALEPETAADADADAVQAEPEAAETPAEPETADVESAETAAEDPVADVPAEPEPAEAAAPQTEAEDSDAAADAAVTRLMAALGAAPAESPSAGEPAPAPAQPDAPADEAEAALAAALSEPLPEPMEPPRARVIKIRRIERTAAPAAEPVAEAAPASALAPEAEVELERELASLATQEPAALRPHLPEAADDGDVQRLIDEANSQLEGPENRRRHSAIAHLKAAVAATVADRRVVGTTPEDTGVREAAYRDDLEKVVRPRRPVAPGTSVGRPAAPAARPAPLVLVSEQRIDRPAATDAPSAAPTGPVMPVRPRRPAASAALSVAPDPVEDDADAALDDGNFFSPSKSFAEFAEALGADALTDLLEAAVAYAALVEGRPHVSRPQMMRHVGSVRPDAEAEREDLLRSFGTLVREGRIERVKAGQFALPDTSGVLAEARRIAS